ncbi:tetratricopeptide repeat protein [Candidatus Sumerlaeota bacterium]|nr:tetratricopeptide repeat protein [Candidatus Sumerlaeota bacterium]
MSFVFTVNASDFEEKVIEASSKKPVAVDFWAPWCAPCRIIGPILERVVLSYNGKILLAKANIEENQELAVQWQIQSIPIVKIFRNGKVWDEFIGAIPESKIRDVLGKLVPTEEDDLASEGNRLLEKGAAQAAESLFYQILQKNPRHSEALYRLAEISLEKEEIEKARQFAKAIDIGEKRHEDAQKILAQIEFLETCKKTGDPKTCRAAVEENPENLDARYHYALCLAAQKDYRKALDQLLFIMEKDRQFKDKSAHQTILRIFSIIGEESEYLDEYRSRLSMILFS